MIDLRDKDVNDRVVQHLLKEPVNDGGQWDMLINLVARYGVVPKAQYPESFSSSSSGKLNTLVISKLRDHAVVLRRMASLGHSIEQLRHEKEKCLKEIYNILAITLGEPPKKPFTWAFRNKDKKYFEFENLTPQAYFKEHVGYPVRSEALLFVRNELCCQEVLFSIANFRHHLFFIHRLRRQSRSSTILATSPWPSTLCSTSVTSLEAALFVTSTPPSTT